MNAMTHHDSLAVAGAAFVTVPPAERRAVMQAYHLWSDLCDGNRLPSADALLQDPRFTFADRSVLIAVQSDCSATVIAVGASLPMSVAQLPADVATIPGRSLLSRVTDHVLEPIANRSPIGFEAEFTDENGADIQYRAIALPCASDGTAIDAVIGIISFATIGDPAVIAVQPAAGLGPAEAPQPSTPPEKTKPNFTKSQIRRIVMSYKEKLSECMAIDGALAVALVDVGSGMALATEQGSAKGLNLEVAAAGNTNVLRAKYDTMKNLGINEAIEDILITLGSQIHLIRPVTSESGKGLFIYLALDKNKANLAMARHKLRQIEPGLVV